MTRTEKTSDKRVLITGMGAVSPVGPDIRSMWDSLVAGKSGVDYISHFDYTDYDTKIAAEVRDFDISAYVDRKQGQRMDRFTQFAVAASLQAMEQAGLTINPAEKVSPKILKKIAVGKTTVTPIAFLGSNRMT